MYRESHIWLFCIKIVNNERFHLPMQLQGDTCEQAYCSGTAKQKQLLVGAHSLHNILLVVKLCLGGVYIGCTERYNGSV